jgi:hypothetical protein
MAAVSLGGCVWGQQTEPPVISTDRPSVGTGPDLVPVHRMIEENGITWSTTRGGTTVDGPEMLVRFGVSKDLELRALPPNFERAPGQPGTEETDFGVSAKVHLPSAPSLPVSLIVGTTAPTGSRTVTAGGWDPSGLVTTSHAWSPRFGSFASADVTWAGGGPNPRQAVTQLAFDGLWNTSATVTTYVEAAPLFSTEAHSSGGTADAGVLWVIRREIQLDVRAGRSWTGSTVATVAGVGFSFSARGWGLAW